MLLYSMCSVRKERRAFPHSSRFMLLMSSLHRGYFSSGVKLAGALNCYSRQGLVKIKGRCGREPKFCSANYSISNGTTADDR